MVTVRRVLLHVTMVYGLQFFSHLTFHLLKNVLCSISVPGQYSIDFDAHLF
jgi:hypothetical protein